MRRAQGALEYLIIIAAVIGIAAVVVYTVSGVMLGQSTSASIVSCKQAATDCKASRLLSPNDPCNNCATACVDLASGKEIFYGATYCCTTGKDNLIYADSPGCGLVFSDTFDSSNGWTGFSGSCTLTGGWCIYSSTALMDSQNGPHSITHAQSTVGYKDITISFDAYTCGTLAWDGYEAEWMKVEWTADGSTWTEILNSTLIVPMTHKSYPLPASADGKLNFAVKISAYDVHSHSDVEMQCTEVGGNLDRSIIDNFVIAGTPIA